MIAVDLSGVADEFVLEVLSNAIGRFLDAARLSEHRAFELALIARWDTTLDSALQIAIEVLAGIQLGRVRRQVKDLDSLRFSASQSLTGFALCTFRLSRIKNTLRLASFVRRRMNRISRCGVMPPA